MNNKFDQIGHVEKIEAFDAIAAIKEEKARVWLDMQKRKQEYRDLKSRWEVLEEEIEKIVRETAHPEETPLYQAAATVYSNGKPQEDDSWAVMPITEALGVGNLGDDGLKKPILKKLVDANLTTMGEFCEWRKSKPLTDIPGIGEKAAEKIETAEAAFWEWWRKRNSVSTGPENRISGLLAAPNGETA